MMPSYEDISYVVEDPYAVITLNRPEQLNAFTFNTLAEIRHAIGLASDDIRVVGIIITGEGRGFSAGLDMAALAAATSSDQAPSGAPSDTLPGIFSYFLEVPKPIIAAVNGVAAGGGLILALMCDLRFASDTASFTTVFLKRGLIAEHGSSWLLPRLLGVSKALDLLWTSDKIDAAEAHRLGLVDEVYAPHVLLEQAKAYLRKVSEVAAPKAIAASKRLVYRHLGQDYESALREAEQVQNTFVSAPDAQEGAAAFIEKRMPVFERLGSKSTDNTTEID